MSVGQRTVRAARGVSVRARGVREGKASKGGGAGRSGIAPLHPVQALRTPATIRSRYAVAPTLCMNRSL